MFLGIGGKSTGRTTASGNALRTGPSGADLPPASLGGRGLTWNGGGLRGPRPKVGGREIRPQGPSVLALRTAKTKGRRGQRKGSEAKGKGGPVSRTALLYGKAMASGSCQ